MAIKLFSSISIGSQSLLEKMSEELNKTEIDFSLRWNPGKNIVLFRLAVGIDGKPVEDLLDRPIGENDGDIVYPIGKYLEGIKLKIQYEIFPLENIDKIATFIVESKKIVSKLSPFPPPPDFIKLKSREILNESKTYIVKGTKN